MDVLITGVSGRIGSELARILVLEGHRVRGLMLPDDPASTTAAEDLQIEVFVGDLTIPGSLVGAVKGVDAICHLAGVLTTHDVEDGLFIDVNLKGTYNLLTAARDHAPEISRFVYTSSDAVYWPSMSQRPLFLPVDESHPLIAGSVYGASKIGAEAMCRAFWSTYGIPYVVARPTATASPREIVDPNSVFGRRWYLDSAIEWLEPRVRSSQEAELLRSLRNHVGGEAKLLFLTDSEGVASLTMLADSRDVAGAIRTMIDHPDAVGEAFNVGPDSPHTDRQLVKKLSQELALEVVQIRFSGVRPSWSVSSAKAKGTLRYCPEWNVYGMVDDAIARLQK